MNKIILSICLVLIALMGIACVSACDADNCTSNEIVQYDVDGYAVDNSSADDAAPYDIDENGVDNSSLNDRAPNDIDESGVDNNSTDDAFPYDLEQYGIDNCPTDGKTPYNVYEHAYYDEDNMAWVDHDLYEFAAEVIWYFNDDGAIDIFIHELGISENDACWLYYMVIQYYHIVEGIAPPDDYDPWI